MEEKQVSYAAYEAMVATNERHIKRLLLSLLIAIILLFASNVAWLWFWSQFEFSDEEYSDIYAQEGEGRFNMNTGTQGDVDYGSPDIYQAVSPQDDDAP